MKQWLANHIDAILVAIIAVVTPIKPLMITIGFLVAVDFIFGLYKARKLKQEITSRKMSNTITKMLLYNLTIISIWLLEKNIIGSEIPITKIAAGMISIVEIKSIDETFKLLFNFSIWDRLKEILQRKESNTK